MKILSILFGSLSFIFPVCAEYSVEPLTKTARIFLIPNFLSDEECEHMIELARPKLERSKIVDNDEGDDDGIVDSRRSSHGAFLQLNPTDPILKGIEDRIAELTSTPVENGEALHVLQYKEGAEFEPHHDYFCTDTPGGQNCLSHGGQRLASCIMYLKEPEAGGETIFPEVDVTVVPKKGTALLFYNCTPEGKVDPHTFHAGVKVAQGEKWIATKWIREREFR